MPVLHSLPLPLVSSFLSHFLLSLPSTFFPLPSLPPSYPLFFPSFFAWRLALNVHHSAKNKRSELIGLSAAALVDPLIRTEKQRYMSEFCFSSSFRVLQLLHAAVTSKVSPPSLPVVLGLGPAAMSAITLVLHSPRCACSMEIVLRSHAAVVIWL